jgi:hypothetical protein
LILQLENLPGAATKAEVVLEEVLVILKEHSRSAVGI